MTEAVNDDGRACAYCGAPHDTRLACPAYRSLVRAGEALKKASGSAVNTRPWEIACAYCGNRHGPAFICDALADRIDRRQRLQVIVDRVNAFKSHHQRMHVALTRVHDVLAAVPAGGDLSYGQIEYLRQRVAEVLEMEGRE
jgi:hypothetical protein